MNLIDHLNVLVFACLYPIYVFFSYRKVKNDFVDNKSGVRINDYKKTTFWLWLLCVITIIIWISNQRSFTLLSIDFSFSWTLVITVLLFLITPVLLLFFFRSTRENNKKRVTIKEKLESVAANEFLPRTKKEFQWFILLSITAGICEELLFRGFLIWYFESLTNTLLAVVLSSILFGLAHSYQGVTGILRSGLMGLILALILVWTDSLLILIFLHIAGDVYNGVIGWLGYGEFKNPKLKNG